MAGPYVQGAVFVDGFFPESRLPLTHEFVDRYEESFGEKPGYLEAQAYDTMRLLAKALGQPEVRSRPQLRDALLGIQVLPGVAGTSSVGADGEVHKPPFLITIQKRQMAEIQSNFDPLSQQPGLEFFLETKHSTRPQGPSAVPKSTVPESAIGTRHDSWREERDGKYEEN